MTSTKGQEPDLIGREELKEKLDRGDDFKLVMVLGEWEYRAKRISGSLRVSTLAELDAEPEGLVDKPGLLEVALHDIEADDSGTTPGRFHREAPGVAGGVQDAPPIEAPQSIFYCGERVGGERLHARLVPRDRGVGVGREAVGEGYVVVEGGESFYLRPHRRLVHRRSVPKRARARQRRLRQGGLGYARSELWRSSLL
jgi:hypothetical protein